MIKLTKLQHKISKKIKIKWQLLFNILVVSNYLCNIESDVCNALWEPHK